MGLLDKAEENIITGTQTGEDPPENSPPQELDDLGKNLVDRILRIPRGPHTAYTALSLMRAYGSFQAGTFFRLENESYISYVSVGIGIRKISIPAGLVFTGENCAAKFFRFNPDEKEKLGFLDRRMDFWCFPMDNDKPWNAILILECIDSASFNPVNLSLLLEAIRENVHPGYNTGNAETPEPDFIPESHIVVELDSEIIQQAGPAEVLQPDDTAYLIEEPDVIVEPAQVSPEDQSDLLSVLADYFQGDEPLDGLLIKIPDDIQDESGGLNKIQSMVSHFAMIQPVSKNMVLLLFPGFYDRELIAHRLKHSLNADIPVTFCAQNQTEAYQSILSFV